MNIFYVLISTQVYETVQRQSRTNVFRAFICSSLAFLCCSRDRNVIGSIEIRRIGDQFASHWLIEHSSRSCTPPSRSAWRRCARACAPANQVLHSFPLGSTL